MTSETQKTQTRQALIAAGLHLFGHQGYAATSTRELAGRAQTNIASIAYHFGGKSGLHLLGLLHEFGNVHSGMMDGGLKFFTRQQSCLRIFSRLLARAGPDKTNHRSTTP